MEPNERSINEYSELINKLDHTAKKLGLYLHGAALIPPPKDSEAPVVMQVSFAVGEKADFTDSEHDDALAAEFEAIVSGADKAEHDQKLEDIKREMESGDFFKEFE